MISTSRKYYKHSDGLCLDVGPYTKAIEVIGRWYYIYTLFMLNSTLSQPRWWSFQGDLLVNIQI